METIACPVCQNELSPFGRRKRSGIDENGEKMLFYLRRLRCKKCKTVHIELPCCLMPYKRYKTPVIEQVISKPEGTTENTQHIAPVEIRTIQKIREWFRKIRPHLEGVWQRCITEGLASPKMNPGLKEYVRAAVNNNFWLATRTGVLSCKALL